MLNSTYRSLQNTHVASMLVATFGSYYLYKEKWHQLAHAEEAVNIADGEVSWADKRIIRYENQIRESRLHAVNDHFIQF